MRACLASDIVFLPERLATWRQHEDQETARCEREFFDRRILDCLELVLYDEKSRIPESWRRIDGWDKQIAAVQRSLYYDTFPLYGSDLRRRPLKFLRAAWVALCREPQLLLRQIGHGFKWSEEFSVDWVVATKRLIDTFGCSWPPRELAADT